MPKVGIYHNSQQLTQPRISIFFCSRVGVYLLVDLKDTENDSGFVNQEGGGGGLYMLAALWKHSESSKEVWGLVFISFIHLSLSSAT